MAFRVPAAQAQPVLESMESRILLSGDSALLPLAGLAGGPAGDSTDRFQWSGYQFQAAASAPLAASAGAAAWPGPTASTVLRYDFPGSPSLEAAQSGFVVSLGQEDQWVSANDPIVPFRESKILLPPGYEIVSVDVQPGPGTVVAQAVPLLTAAAPLPMIDGADLAGGLAPDPAPVLASQSFPTSQAVTFSTQVLCGYSIGVLAVFPVGYDAAGGTLTYYPQMQVTVTAAPAVGRDNAPLRNDAADLQRVLDLVDNDAAAQEYALPAGPAGLDGSAALPPVSPLGGTLPPIAGAYQYVLITSPALAGTFQQLVDQKLARGISATMVTTDYIYSHYNSAYSAENDNAGKIRAFLKDAYTNWGTHYVLLGGDTAQVPARMVYCLVGSYTADLASDMYYASLDGPFNNDGDAHWGESTDGASGREVDLVAELSVGRAPVDTTAEAQNFINKTILYENTPQPNASRMVQIGEKLDETPTWGEDSLDYIAADSFPAALQVTTLYQRDGTYSVAAVKAALNASPNFVNHLGHSSYTTNAGLSRADVDALTNAFPYIFYSQGCNAGQFELNDAIAEHHLKDAHSAVAAIMNSNYGWYTPGYAAGAGTQWALAFWQAIFGDDVLAFGDAHFAAKTDRLSTVQPGTSDRWTFFASTLFGDPETHVYFPRAQAPRVLSSAPVGDSAAGQSRLRVQFGEPMDPASFSLADDLVSFTAPGGFDLRDRVTGYVWEDFYTLDVLFAPQTAPGTYEMVLGPGILDTTGTAMDQDGDAAPGEGGQDAYRASFTIRSAPSGSGTIYQADMTSDPLWTIIGGSGDDRWAWGVPAGTASDPTSGHTGQAVLGYNLNGSYPNSMTATQYAVTPVIDCSVFKGVTLSFWRWLRVHASSYDSATIDVTNDGVTWHNVWINTNGVYDTAWSLKTLDIAAYADGQSAVQVRWGMGPTNQSVTYGGWNIDDVLITGSQDYPTVLAQSPAARAAEGLDHLDVTFAGAITPASLTAEDFTLTGPDGPIAVTGVQHVQGDTYRATFQPQSAPGEYQVSIGPDVANLLGFAMDQNGDGTPGQAGVDAYHGSFQIVAADLDGPTVAASSPAGVGIAAISSFVFTFDEDMDSGSFSPADIASFTGPGGADLRAAVTGFVWLDARHLKVSFRPQQRAGTYELTIGPDIRDALPGANPMDQDGDGTAGQPADTYTASYRLSDSDLVGSSFALAPASLDSGGGTTLASFKVRNTGTAAGGPFKVRFYLSADATINPLVDLPLTLEDGASFYQAADLAGGAELTAAARLVLPAADPFAGNNDYRIGMVIDTDNEVVEVNEANNANAGAGLDLAAAYYGRIFGKAWADTNGDAVMNAGELGLAQQTVYLDTDNDGTPDPGEPSVLTGADGGFVFRYLPDGQYKLRQVVPAGWGLSTQPLMGGAYDLTLALGQTVTNRNFGNYRYAAISGTAFLDADLDGVRDVGETALAGRTVYLDSNNNATPDGAELSVVTGQNGSFAFGNLTPGTYRLRQVLPGGWVCTAPAAGYYPLTLASGSAAAGLDFGNADSAGFLPAETFSWPTQGVRYTLYHHNGASSVDDLDVLTPVARGPAGNFDISLRDQQEDYGFIYTGYVHVPADGIYTFYTDSDGGSKLYVGGLAVVDNDGYHSTQEADGRIGLKAGDHAITVKYIQAASEGSLTVSYQGAGLPKAAIPDAALRFTANLPPVAGDDAYQARQDGSLAVPAAAGVLANDADADAGPAGLSVGLAFVASPAHGQLQLRPDGSFLYTPTPGYWGADCFTYRTTDGFDSSNLATVSIAVQPTPVVTGRYVFYNNSTWDDPAKGRTDDNAIAPDKLPLLPGHKAAFENYTNYTRGLNGVIVDVFALPASVLGLDDFVFRVGNSDTPANWAAAPAPTISLRKGAGQAGADRVTLTWPDNAIAGKWLQVTLKADPNTQLPADDVFYFGNAPGEIGNSAAEAQVNALDVVTIRNNQTTFLNPPTVANRYDINRNGQIDAIDVILSRNNQTTFLTVMKLITPPAPASAPLAKPAPAVAADPAVSLAVAPAAPAPLGAAAPLTEVAPLTAAAFTQIVAPAAPAPLTAPVGPVAAALAAPAVPVAAIAAASPAVASPALPAVRVAAGSAASVAWAWFAARVAPAGSHRPAATGARPPSAQEAPAPFPVALGAIFTDVLARANALSLPL